MPTSLEKFRKLLAAYEDEVLRTQHKMSKKVEPTDEARPDWLTGSCAFVRGDAVVWSPAFEVIGSYVTETKTWTWGFADPGLEWRIRTRMQEVKRQGMSWSIDLLTADSLQLADEQQAWELSTVAAAVTRADGLHRYEQGGVVRFLALFEDAPPRSSAGLRAVGESHYGLTPIAGPVSSSKSTPPGPAFKSSPPGPALRRQLTPMPTTPTTPGEREPTSASRHEVAQRLLEAVPYVHQHHLGEVSMLVRAVPPTGPVGTVNLEFKMTLKPNTGGPDVLLAPTAVLHDALAALWNRCHESGAGFRFLTAHVEVGPNGPSHRVDVEW